MKNSKKLILVMVSIICIVILLVGSIAYYRIVVNGSIKGSTGNAVFVLRDSDNSVWNNKVIDLGKINPGDSGEFTVTMDASGSTVDMYATLEIERTNLPTNLKFYTTSDHKSELHKYYSFLEKSGTIKETLTIYWYWNPYIDDIEDTKYINKSFNASINVSAVQISEYAMMKNGNGVTSDSRLYFWKDTYRPYIRTITFGNDLSNLPSSCTEENLCWDLSYNTSQKKKVYGYLIDSGLTVQVGVDESNNPINQALYNLYIVSSAPIFAPSDCSLFFAGFNSLVSINYNDNFNTSKVVNMSYMFLPICSYNGDWSSTVTLTSSIKNVKPSFLVKTNDSKVEMMWSGGSRDSFYSVIEKLDLSSFNTSKVINMDSMFEYCSSLTSLNLSSFNTPKVTNMSSMFASCSSLTSLNLSSFDTSSVTDMSYMFSGCSSLTSLDLNSFNTSNVTGMDSMFLGCSSLTSLDLSNFNTSKVINMDSMFEYCSSLTSLNLSSFNTSKVTDMRGMFENCSSLTSLDLNGFNTSSVTNMGNMFNGCSSLISLDLSSFNTSNVTDMGWMFRNCSAITSLDVSNFNTSNVTNMSHMFSDCTKIQVKITIMNPNMFAYDGMFSNALNDENAYAIISYTIDTQSIAESIKSEATYPTRITLKQI